MDKYSISAPGYQLDANLRSGQVFRWRQHPDGSWLGFEAGHQVRLWQEDCTLHFESTAPRTAIEDFLGLSDPDYQHRLTRFGQSPELKPWIERYRGMTILRPDDPVEAMFSFLCASNSNIRRIEQMVEALASLAAQPPHFPTLEEIAQTSEGRLRELGLGYRATTIPLVAQQLLTKGGKTYIGGLREAPYEEAREALISLPGVGPKLADCIAIYALRQPLACPIDVHVWRALGEILMPEYHGRTLTEVLRRDATAQIRQRFGPDTMHVQHLLFHASLTKAFA